jgi:hypothetical protein
MSGFGIPIHTGMGEDIQGADRAKRLALRYAGSCRECGTDLPPRTVAIYDKTTRTVMCLECHEGSVVARQERPAEQQPTTPAAAEIVATPPIAAGTAGASARREFERRQAKRVTQVREAHPHLGGLILALSDDPQSTRAWDSGARGEEALGRGLDRQAEKGVRVLHDRRIRGTRANIDHIAVGPSGVYAIDAKRYVDKRPSLRVEGGFLRPRVEKLMVGSSDRSKLVEGSQWQVAKLRAALDDAGFVDVPAFGVLCFLDANWPLFGGSFSIGGVAVLWPKAVYERLSATGPLDVAAIDQVHLTLAEAFPVA